MHSEWQWQQAKSGFSQRIKEAVGANPGENAAHLASRVPEHQGVERHAQIPFVAEPQRQHVVGAFTQHQFDALPGAWDR